MLTVTEVAARLKVSRSTIYNAIEAGILPHYRIGLSRGAIRISEEQLAKFLESTKVEEGASTLVKPRDIQYRDESPETATVHTR
jgi:excisionase family DNA binding protein